MLPKNGASWERPLLTHAKVEFMIFDWNEIIQNRLWVGSFVRPEEVRFLEDLKISTVLSLQSDDDLASYNIPVERLLRAYSSAKIQYRRVAIPDFDTQALSIMLAQAVEELESALKPSGARVYAHCTAGINRSPTLAAAFLIKNKRLSAREAYDYVAARRQCSPYLSVLQEYAESVAK
jgi:protein-tyrosine phosphatase